MQQTKQTQSMFLTRGLERILADKELRKSYNAQLKKACNSALGNAIINLLYFYEYPIKFPNIKSKAQLALVLPTKSGLNPVA